MIRMTPGIVKSLSLRIMPFMECAMSFMSLVRMAMRIQNKPVTIFPRNMITAIICSSLKESWTKEFDLKLVKELTCTESSGILPVWPSDNAKLCKTQTGQTV
jgi:hypothetical protein